MHASSIPGYRYGDDALERSPVTIDDLEKLKTAIMFDSADVEALRQARPILTKYSDEILDIWYEFIGSHDFLVAYFSTPDGPDANYLERVRARFAQWIDDTCRAEYDQTWLDYQEEIGRRHYPKKNQTDDAEGTPPVVSFRYINTLVYPVYATVRPFLERDETDAEQVEKMHQAWLKAVLLHVTLWSRPFMHEGAF